MFEGEEDNCVTLFWEYDGTHQNGELFGKPPSGKQVRVKGTALLEIEDGRVKRETGIVNNLSLIWMVLR